MTTSPQFGPRPRPATARQVARLNINMRPAERERIFAAAAGEGLSVSAWCRARLLRGLGKIPIVAQSDGNTIAQPADSRYACP